MGIAYTHFIGISIKDLHWMILDDSYLYFHKNKTLEWFRRSIENIRSKIKQ